MAFVRLLLTTSGLRRAEGGSLLTFEVPIRQLNGGRYYRGKVAAQVTRSKKPRTFYVAADAVSVWYLPQSMVGRRSSRGLADLLSRCLLLLAA